MTYGNKCHNCGTLIEPGREIVRAGNDGKKVSFCSLQCRGERKVVEWVIPGPEKEIKT